MKAGAEGRARGAHAGPNPTAAFLVASGLGLLLGAILPVPASAQYLDFRKAGTALPAVECLVADLNGDGGDEVLARNGNFVYLYAWRGGAFALACQIPFDRDRDVRLIGAQDVNGDRIKEFGISETGPEDQRIHIRRWGGTDSVAAVAEIVHTRISSGGELNRSGAIAWDVGAALVGGVGIGGRRGIVVRFVSGYSGQPRGLICFDLEPPHEALWRRQIGPCPEESLPVVWGRDAASTYIPLCAAGYGSSPDYSGLPSTRAAVLVCDGYGRIRWAEQFGARGTAPRAVLADVNADGIPEILVTSRQQAEQYQSSARLRVLSLDGATLGDIDTGTSVDRMAAADLDGDGHVEIVLLCGSGEIRIYGEDLQLVRSLQASLGSTSFLAIENVDAIGTSELLLTGEDGAVDIYDAELRRVGSIEPLGEGNTVMPLVISARDRRMLQLSGLQFRILRAVPVSSPPWEKRRKANVPAATRWLLVVIGAFAGAVALSGSQAAWKKRNSTGGESERALFKELGIIRHGERHSGEKKEPLVALRRALETAASNQPVSGDRESLRRSVEVLRSYVVPALHRASGLAWRAGMPGLAWRLRAGLRAVVRSTGSLATSDPSPAATELRDRCTRALGAIAELESTLRRLEMQTTARIAADPVQTATAACSALRVRLEETGVELDGLHVTGRLDVRVFMDPGALRRSLIHLLQNSIEAVAEAAAPRISVEIHGGERKATIAVRDNGCGIDADRWDLIFQGDSNKTPRGGTGLIESRESVMAHSGRIRVRESSAWDSTVIEIELHALPS